MIGFYLVWFGFLVVSFFFFTLRRYFISYFLLIVKYCCLSPWLDHDGISADCGEWVFQVESQFMRGRWYLGVTKATAKWWEKTAGDGWAFDALNLQRSVTSSRVNLSCWARIQSAPSGSWQVEDNSSVTIGIRGAVGAKGLKTVQWSNGEKTWRRL